MLSSLNTHGHYSIIGQWGHTYSFDSIENFALAHQWTVTAIFQRGVMPRQICQTAQHHMCFTTVPILCWTTSCYFPHKPPVFVCVSVCVKGVVMIYCYDLLDTFRESRFGDSKSQFAFQLISEFTLLCFFLIPGDLLHWQSSRARFIFY